MLGLVVALTCVVSSAGQLNVTSESNGLGQYGSDYQYEDIITPDRTPPGGSANTTENRGNVDGTNPANGNAGRGPAPSRPLTDVFPDYTVEGGGMTPGTGTPGQPNPFKPGPWPPQFPFGIGRNFKWGGYPTDNMALWNSQAMLGGDDMMENLHREFLIIQHYGLADRLDEMQKFYPGMNIKQMYDYYLQQPMAGRRFNYGPFYEWEDSVGYWHNGTLRYYRYDPDEIGYEADEGFWFNGTFYPELDDMLEDGFWYNGSFYPTDIERPEFDDGFFYNGTFYHLGEYDELDDMGGLDDREDLMWWQLHHPRWRDRTNNGRQQSPPSSTTSVSAFPLPQKTHSSPSNPGITPMRNRQGVPPPWYRGRTNSTFYPNPYRRRWENPMYQRRQGPPSFQPNQRSSFPLPQQRIYRNGNVKPRTNRYPPRLIDIDPMFAKYRQTNYPSNFRPDQSMRKTPLSQSLATVQKEKVTRKSSPLDPYRGDSTVAIGITIACIIGLILILGPLICMLNNYRRNKRMKKRTFLRRPELSASVEEGLIDTMVRTELDAAGGAGESLTFGRTASNVTSYGKGLGFAAAAARPKTTGVQEKKWKEKRETREDLGGKTRQGKGEWARKLQSDVEMKEMRREKRRTERTVTPLASSSSFYLRHQQYDPRNTDDGAGGGGKGVNPSTKPLSVVGMDSDDEMGK